MGHGGLHPEPTASLAAPIPSWELGAREGQCCVGGAGVGAGVKDPGWVVCEEEGAGVMEEPQLPSVLMWYWEAVIILLLSSPSITSLLQREKGGRRESILLGTAVAWSQGTNLLALLGRSQPALGRKINR